MKGSRLPHGRRSPHLGSPSPPQRPGPKAAERTVTYSLTQDIHGARVLLTQTVGRSNFTVGDRPPPAVHIDCDYFSKVVGFDLMPDVSFVYVLAELDRLFAWATWECDAPLALRARRGF